MGPSPHRRTPVGWGHRTPVGWGHRTRVGRTGAPTCSSGDRPAADGAVAGGAVGVARRAGGSPGLGPAGVGARAVGCRADGWGAAAGLAVGRGGGPVRVLRRGAGGRRGARQREQGRPGGRGRPNAVVGMGQRAHPGSPGARPASGAHHRSPAVRRADHDRCRLTVPMGSGFEVAALQPPGRGRSARVPGVAPRPVRESSPVLGAGRGRPAGSARRARATNSGRRAGPDGRTDRARRGCGGGPGPRRGRRRGNPPTPAAGLGRPPGAPRRVAGGAAPRRGGSGGCLVHPRIGRCTSRRGGSAPAGAPWPGRHWQLARARQAAGCVRSRCRRGSAGRGTADTTRWSARPSRTARRGGATGRRIRRDSSARPVAGVAEGAALACPQGMRETWRGRLVAFGRAPMTGSRPLAHGDCHLVAPCRAGHPPAVASSVQQGVAAEGG